jgi:hypothetical protein
VTDASGSLERAVVSIARTQRGRFAWAVWWTGAPSVMRFRKPDASGGGFASWHEARAAAEQASGRALTDLDPGWAHAFLRTLRGQPALNEVQRRRLAGERPPPSAREKPRSIWETLGVGARATEIHPDRGGSDAAFREVRAAYEEALQRARRPKSPTRRGP